MNVQPLKTLCRSAALAACLAWTASATAADMSDPAQIQTEAFIQLLQADQALDAGRLEEALPLYTAARDAYERVASEFPSYDPRVIQYRRDYCEGQIDEVMASLGMVPREADPVELPGDPAAPEADPEPRVDEALAEPSVTATLRANLAAALAERDSIRDAMSAQTAARKAEVEVLRVRIAELEAAAAAPQAVAVPEPDPEAAKAAEKAARDLEKVRQEKADLKKKLKEAEKAAEQAAAGFAERIAELEAALEAKDSELAAKAEETAGLEAGKVRREEQAAQLGERVAELTAQLGASESAAGAPVPSAELADEVSGINLALKFTSR